jgi:hypothetical protein
MRAARFKLAWRGQDANWMHDRAMVSQLRPRPSVAYADGILANRY